MTDIPPSWKAEFLDGFLHISGVATYPNDFSTATLERVHSNSNSDILTYRVVFHRDKEPFCGPDLIGPVHYFEKHLPTAAAHILVSVDGHQVQFPIPTI